MLNEGRQSVEKIDTDESNRSGHSEIDLYSFHEQAAGRLVIDPGEAKVEFGEAVASRLKLSPDGTKVLWPQPTDSMEDPQNWSDRRKLLMLIIVTLVRPCSNFEPGVAAVFKLAIQYNITPAVINNRSTAWSIFLLGWGGIAAVILIRRVGRLPVLFWSQVLGVAFLVGATFAPNLKTLISMRCLSAFFATTPQVTGLYIVTDLYPFHLQARTLNIWTMGFIVSPFLSPFALGFLVARTSWRWAFGIGSIYGAVVVVLIALFVEETMYDRTVRPIPPRPTSGVRYRIESLVGITGLKMAKYRISWSEAIISPLRVVWRPHIFGLLVFEALLFGFGIGINVTTGVLLGTPPPLGFSWSEFAIAGVYGTPIVSVILGELIGRYLNDGIMNWSIRRNKGIFEAETRLWACYVALPLYICGFLVLGAGFQKHLSPGAIVMGWGLAEVATMINTVAVSLTRLQGEISALLNLWRTLGGFAVSYFQIPWATEHGALQVFGVEAAIVAGLFLVVIPPLQRKGRSIRARFSLH
ncbi:MFS general substrate transporter [Mycena maculata]|uniref:MFS general substrate transporter n=1 Tax=Mycena maculata TaxID=230809 RepID=A0AAD7JJR8_9AGAR|nr:MFS general substrate transporter [Mycena maculata]